MNRRSINLKIMKGWNFWEMQCLGISGDGREKRFLISEFAESGNREDDNENSNDDK